MQTSDHRLTNQWMGQELSNLFFGGGWTSMAFIELPKILWHLWFAICEVVCTASPCVSDTEHTLSTLRTGVSWARKRSPVFLNWGFHLQHGDLISNDDSLCEVIPGQSMGPASRMGRSWPPPNIGVSTTDKLWMEKGEGCGVCNFSVHPIWVMDCLAHGFGEWFARLLGALRCRFAAAATSGRGNRSAKRRAGCGCRTLNPGALRRWGELRC